MAGARTAVVAVMAAALALTTAACGSAAQKAAKDTVEKAAELTPAALLELVGRKTGDAKSAKVEEHLQMGTGAGEMVMTGPISWANGLQGELVVDPGNSPMAAQLSKLSDDGKVRYRYLPEAMYMQIGDKAAGEMGGKHWLKYNYADLGKLLGASGDAMRNQFKSADPVAGVQALIASGKVVDAGKEDVKGVQARHYTGDLTLDDIATATSRGLSADQTEALRKQLTTAGITTEHIEVWVNSDNLMVRRLEQAETKNGTFKATVDYSDYGVKVVASEPPAADTADFADIIKQAKQGAAS